MGDERKKSGGAGCAIMGVIGLMLPVLYVLSIGPVTWLAWQFPTLVVLLYAYRPLYFVAEHCEPVMDALDWYINLFRSLPRLPPA